MQVKVFAVYDKKAQTFTPPFCMQFDGQAIRTFSDHCQDTRTPVNKHPGDYCLYRIGEYDDNTAKLEGIIPEHLCEATEFVNQIQSNNGGQNG